jgi:hypothetical protein
LYVPLPLTVTFAPTAVPPLVQVVGAVDCGPNTLKVIFPLAAGLVVPPDNVAMIELLAIALPSPSVPGALTVTLVAFVTVVEVMPAPQELLDALSLLSPP